MGVKLNSSGGGSVEINPPSTASTFTLTAPAITDTIVTKTSTDTLTNKTLTSPTITGASMSSMASSVLTLMTAVASTSGTSIDFTGIPSWARRITVMFAGVSTNGTSNPLIQIGAGSVLTTGYVGVGAYCGASVGVTSYTSGFGIPGGVATNTYQGSITLSELNVTSNIWVASGVIAQPSTAFSYQVAGTVTLSGALDRVRITTVNGTDAFDAGSINVMYE